MIKKLVLLPAILSIAGLLMAADSASAHPGSSGGHSSGGHSSGGGGHSSGGHVGGGHGGGYYGGGHYGGGYFGGGYGYYGDLGFYGNNPYYYPSYSNPNYSYYAGPGVQPYEPQYSAQPAPVVNDYANVRVILPDPQARVWFDGSLTRQTGTDRLFNTPSLTMGSTYNYQVRASWIQNGREVTQDRTVSVTPGQTALVDFTR